MRSRSNNSSKRGACKRGVDEGRSRSSCSGKSRKRDAQERGRVAGKGGRATAGGRGDVERDPQGQNVEGKASTCNLLNAKWVLIEEGTHGRRVKHGLEGSGLGSSGPLCKRHNQWGEGEGPMCKRSSQ